jgi:hypothetical protein
MALFGRQLVVISSIGGGSQSHAEVIGTGGVKTAYLGLALGSDPLHERHTSIKGPRPVTLEGVSRTIIASAEL